jgi:hypothetical protein
LIVLTSLAMVGWITISAIRGRAVGPKQLTALAGLETLIVIQLVAGLVAVINGVDLPSRATFLAYVIAAPAILPVAVVWSRSDQSRSSTLVRTVGCAAVPVMTARLLQMWAGHA